MVKPTDMARKTALVASPSHRRAPADRAMYRKIGWRIMPLLVAVEFFLFVVFLQMEIVPSAIAGLGPSNESADQAVPNRRT
jgi:hypothetical protein